MILTQQQVIQSLTAAGVYRPTWNVADNEYTTLSRQWVTDVAWPTWVDSLPKELVESVDLFGGKPVRRPKWIPNVFDCDNHTFSFREYVIRCCAVDCVKKGIPRGGTPMGSLSYIATPKADNRREGAHDTNIFIEHSGEVLWFEPAEGFVFTPEKVEVISVWEGDMR